MTGSERRPAARRRPPRRLLPGRCGGPLVATLLLASAASLEAQPVAEAPVIVAGASAITRAQFEELLAGSPGADEIRGRPEAIRALAERFGQALALEAEAKRRQLDAAPAFRLALRAYSQQLLAHELLRALRAEYRADEAALLRHYEANRAAWDEPRVRQIFVRTRGSQVAPPPGRPDRSPAEAEARARELAGRLAAGADFAELARAESDDPVSRERGGDLGFVARGSTEAAFEAAAFSLAVGAVSAPVRGENGFYLLRVEERRAPTLERIGDALANDLAHREMERIALTGFTIDESQLAR